MLKRVASCLLKRLSVVSPPPSPEQPQPQHSPYSSSLGSSSSSGSLPALSTPTSSPNLTSSASLTSISTVLQGDEQLARRRKRQSLASIHSTASSIAASVASTASTASAAPSSQSSSTKLQTIVADDALDFSLPVADITGLELSLVPVDSQTKECSSTFRSLLPRRIWSDFMVKRGGMITNWKTRYFLLTGDHLHYFEPQTTKGNSDQLGEPAANATPLGSVALHSITGKVHKSDLGITFGFQVPTTQRTYHFQAMSAKRIERWLAIMNANVKRIQSTSSKFSDTVKRVSFF